MLKIPWYVIRPHLSRTALDSGLSDLLIHSKTFNVLCFLPGATNCDIAQPRPPDLSYVPVPSKHEGAWQRARLPQDPFQPALSEVCIHCHLL